LLLLFVGGWAKLVCALSIHHLSPLPSEDSDPMPGIAEPSRYFGDIMGHVFQVCSKCSLALKYP